MNEHQRWLMRKSYEYRRVAGAKFLWTKADIKRNKERAEIIFRLMTTEPA